MRIAGLQKTTLIDYPGFVACTIFLAGCNFRCGFCHNPELITQPVKGTFTKEEILTFLTSRKGKLDAVCITGGEPLLSIDKTFVKQIKELGYLIKIDTNGSCPEQLKTFIDEGLVDYIAMDIKASPTLYQQVAGVNVDLSALEQSLKLIHHFGTYELRTTIITRFHNQKEMKRIAQWLNKTIGTPNNYYLQGFKVQEQLLDNDFLKENDVTEKQLQTIKQELQPLINNIHLRT